MQSAWASVDSPTLMFISQHHWKRSLCPRLLRNTHSGWGKYTALMP